MSDELREGFARALDGLLAERNQLRAERDAERESRFRWAEEAAHVEAEVKRLTDLVDWYNKAGTLELANHDRAMDERDARIAALTGELAGLRASAVVLPEPVQRLVDWHLSSGSANVSPLPLQGEVREALEGWRPATVEAAPVSKLDLAAGICSCGNRFDGDNLCMPSACQMEDLTDAAGVSGTGTEAAPLADLPEAQWREFHEGALSARAAPSPAVVREAPMQITVTSGGDGGPGMRDINAAFAQHAPEDGAQDDRGAIVDVLTDADEDWHTEHGGSGALMARRYLERLADTLLARYDIRERGETA